MDTPRRLSVPLLALCCVACGGDDDGVPSGVDGGPPTMVRTDCTGITAMDLGRCALDAGGDCRGEPGEAFGFAPLADGADMHMVVGPQGSTMLVFLARADGIDPGDPASPRAPGNPLVEVALLDGGTQLTLYRQRVAFTPDSGGRLVSAQLWVVMDELASSVSGRTLAAVANVRDSNGEERCGRARVTAQR